jgi:hypothetical protein
VTGEPDPFIASSAHRRRFDERGPRQQIAPGATLPEPARPEQGERQDQPQVEAVDEVGAAPCRSNSCREHSGGEVGAILPELKDGQQEPDTDEEPGHGPPRHPRAELLGKQTHIDAANRSAEREDG